MNNNFLNRRAFLKSGIAGSLAAGAVGTSHQAHASQGSGNTAEQDGNRRELYLDTKKGTGPFTAITKKRPNIFLITADMISPDCYLPSRGISSHVNLPNILSIGKAGTRFDNALCTSPLCGPARASMFSHFIYSFVTGGIGGTAFMWHYTFPNFNFFLQLFRACLDYVFPILNCLFKHIL